MSRRVKIRYFLSKIVKIRAMSQKKWLQVRWEPTPHFVPLWWTHHQTNTKRPVLHLDHYAVFLHDHPSLFSKWLFIPSKHQLNMVEWGRCYKNKSILWISCIRCMFFHMPLQITWMFARVIASVASKGFLASVRMFVIFQSAWSSARVTALIACEGILSRMLPHVSLGITSLVGWIVALVTTEILLPWVCWYVLFEVIRSCDGIDTQSAMK